jgi:hypothetical protein
LESAMFTEEKTSWEQEMLIREVENASRASPFT